MPVKIVLDFPSLLASGNVRAFIRVLRSGESWNDPNDAERDELAWRVRYHPTQYPTYFDSFDQHPRIFEQLKDGSGRVSSAAGALQITATTWDAICAKYEGIGPRFSPDDQMRAGVALIHDAGALDDVIDGDLVEAVRKCGPVWASLPGSSLEDGGSKMSWDRVQRVYREYGGTLAGVEQPAAPIEDRGTPARPQDVDRITEEQGMSPLIVPIISTLGQLIPAIAGLFGKSGEKVAAKADAAAKVVEIVTQAVGAVNGEQAVTKMQADPAAVAAAKGALFTDPVVGNLLVEVGGGIEAAWRRNVDPASPPFWRQGAFYITLILVGIATAVVASVLLADHWRPEDRSQVLMLAVAVISNITGFWLGSSFGSTKKTDLLAQQRESTT